MSGDPILVVGGGIAGIAAAVEFVQTGRKVVLLEKRPFLGGRATSFVDRETGETIDNCQHVVLGCCTNVLDLFRQLGVENGLEFTEAFHFATSGNRVHTLRPGWLPAPLHFLPGLLSFGALSLGERLQVARGFLRMMMMSKRQLRRAEDQTMAEWLYKAHQSESTIGKFWEPILVSAVNESLVRASALPCLQVFLQGFLPHRKAARMGVPRVPLHDLYSEPATRFLEKRGAEVRTRCAVKRLVIENGRVQGTELNDGRILHSDSVVLAVPPQALNSLLGEEHPNPWSDGSNPGAFEHSPITGIHLWFDRQVVQLPHAFLLNRTTQWIFAKEVDENARALGAVQRLQVVVSASRSLDGKSQGDIIRLVTSELEETFPGIAEAQVIRGVVVRENRATISVLPHTEPLRPPEKTTVPGLVVAGDWTRSGWPATLEGAVRSGRRAATALLGDGQNRMTEDLPRSILARCLLWRSPRHWPTSGD